MPSFARHNHQARMRLESWAARFEAAGKGLSPQAQQAIASYMTKITIDHMNRAQTPLGVPHKPLTPPYVKRKLRQGYSPNIWQRTGESKKKVKTVVKSPTKIVTTIDTPYSGYAHRLRRVLGQSYDERKVVLRIIKLDYARQIGGTNAPIGGLPNAH